MKNPFDQFDAVPSDPMKISPDVQAQRDGLRLRILNNELASADPASAKAIQAEIDATGKKPNEGIIKNAVASLKVKPTTQVQQANPFDQFDEEPKKASNKKTKDSSALKAVKVALSPLAGVNKFVYNTLPGMAVDTIQNVIDLGKAGYGTVATALGRPDLAPNINLDRSNIVGSSDWFNKKTHQVGLGAGVDNPAPDNPLARIGYGTGQVIGGAVVGNPNPMAAVKSAVASGVAGSAASEIDPNLGMIVGMGTPLIAPGYRAARQKVLIGGDKAVQQAKSNLNALQAAGVEEPTLGMVSPRKAVSGVENLLFSAPGAMGKMQEAKSKVISDLQAQSNKLRDLASTDYGTASTGRAIQNDIQNVYQPALMERSTTNYDKLAARMRPGTYPVDNATNALNRITRPMPGAEVTTSSLVPGGMNELRNNLQADVNSPIPTGSRNPYSGNTTKPQGGLPFDAIKRVRTDVGNKSGAAALINSPEQKALKSVYAALSDDIKAAAGISDTANTVSGVNSKSAIAAFDRANAHYKAAIDRLEKLQPILDKSNPEQAYLAAANSGKENVTLLQTIKKSVTPGTRGQIAATTIDRLGMSPTGNWSLDTFASNYGRLKPQAREELFSGFDNAPQVKKSLEDFVKGTQIIKSANKVWANPSGTEAASYARALLPGSIGATLGASALNPLAGLAVGGSALAAMGANRYAANKLTDAAFRNKLLADPFSNPEQAARIAAVNAYKRD